MRRQQSHANHRAHASRSSVWVAASCFVFASGCSRTEDNLLALLARVRGFFGSPVTSGANRMQPEPDSLSAELQGGTDCPPDMARCIDGRIESSVGGRVSPDCRATDTPHACECRWLTIAHCGSPHACVAAEVEVAVHSAAAAIDQLCATDKAPAEARFTSSVAPPKEDASCTHATNGFHCVQRTVQACDAATGRSTVIATCRFGCAAGISLIVSDDEPPGHVAAALLCGTGPGSRAAEQTIGHSATHSQTANDASM